MQNQKLCLKWNNHMSNMLSLLGSFQQKDMLVDVTISCQGQNIKAHKVILSACSQYFQNIFMENPCQHPIIIINGMKFEDVSAILNFMYKGEVNVSQDGLSSFLQAAEALKVKGLAEVCGEKKGTNSITQEVQQSEVNRPQRTDTPPRKRPRNRKRSLSDSNRSDDEGLTRKHREPSSPEVHELSGDESFTGDNSSNGPPFNSVPRVPHNVYSHSRSHQSSNIADEDEEYDVESNKMLDTSDSNVSMNNNADNNLRIERIMGNTEIESSSLQEPESPPDIKPIISYGESSAGTSESGAMMLYNEQSQPGPSNAQDGSLLHDNSHTQEYSNFEKMSHDNPEVPLEFLPFLKQRPQLSIFGTKTPKPSQPTVQPIHYRCDMCHFETNVHQLYQNHLAEHKSQKDYNCPICCKVYKSESRLQLHMQSHETVFPFMCMYCEKRFKSQAILNNHMKTHFPEEITCSLCKKRFNSKAGLKRHIMTIHSNESFPK